MTKNNDKSRALTPQQRAALLRQTFHSITAVGFMKWKAEELALGNKLSDKHRKAYFDHFKKNNFQEFLKMAGKASDERLLAAKGFWIAKAETMGLKEWQEVLSKGQGMQAWCDAFRQEIESKNAHRLAPERKRTKDHFLDR
jgi:hypothetical protein